MYHRTIWAASGLCMIAQFVVDLIAGHTNPLVIVAAGLWCISAFAAEIADRYERDKPRPRDRLIDEPDEDNPYRDL